jgi:phospholipid-translocating ATPase
VTLEVAKFIQAIFISYDIDLYYEHLDYPCTVKSSSLNEELGQVEFIFSDKTGTLTRYCFYNCRNKMDFLKFSCSGKAYGTGISIILIYFS